MRRLAILAVCLLFAGCPDGSREAGADPVGLRQRLGAAEVVAASLLVQLTPRQGEGELFTLRLWRDADGAVRVRAQKLDVDFLDALVRSDGAYEAVLVREGLATAGSLDAADAPPLLSDLRLLLAELRDGPLPRDAVPAGDARLWRWREGERSVELDLDRDGLPSAKRLNAGGTVVRELAYARWQDFEGLRRPSQVRLTVPGGDAMSVRLKSLDAPPRISAERMALHVPAGAARVEPGEFSRRMLGAPPAE